jgi:hypothetical protein
MTSHVSANTSAPDAAEALSQAIGLATVAIAALERGVLGVDEEGERFTGNELAGTNVNSDARRLAFAVEQARFVVERLPPLIAELRAIVSDQGTDEAR